MYRYTPRSGAARFPIARAQETRRLGRPARRIVPCYSHPRAFATGLIRIPCRFPRHINRAIASASTSGARRVSVPHARQPFHDRQRCRERIEVTASGRPQSHSVRGHWRSLARGIRALVASSLNPAATGGLVSNDLRRQPALGDPPLDGGRFAGSLALGVFVQVRLGPRCVGSRNLGFAGFRSGRRLHLFRRAVLCRRGLWSCGRCGVLGRLARIRLLGHGNLRSLRHTG